MELTVLLDLSLWTSGYRFPEVFFVEPLDLHVRSGLTDIRPQKAVKRGGC